MRIDNYNFNIMCHDDIVSEVFVEGENVNVIKHINHVGLQPFYGGEIDVDRVERFIQSRCFNPARPDKERLLFHLGLEEYVPMAIVRKTHGHMHHDGIWIKFPDEDITWEDVLNGAR